ncbi:MAG: hypothetical protein ACKO0Z_08365 [Betaproteobacteria bacterium]
MEADFANAAFAHVESLGILPCHYPNVGGFTDTDHIRVSILPTTPQKLSICSAGSKRLWILQCLVCVRDGVGIVKADEYVDQLQSGIPFLTELAGGFTAIDDGAPLPPLVHDGWFCTPVQFRFLRVN